MQELCRNFAVSLQAIFAVELCKGICYRDVIVATTMFISCVLSGYRLANVAKRHIVTDIKVNLISLLSRYVKICCQN